MMLRPAPAAYDAVWLGRAESEQVAHRELGFDMTALRHQQAHAASLLTPLREGQQSGKLAGGGGVAGWRVLVVDES